MSPRTRNVLAVIAGLVAGGVVNMALITLSPLVIPPPEGVDVTSTEGLRAGIHLLRPRHFIMPFLAHALGTLVGAILAARLAATHKVPMAYVVGGFFLVGGIAASAMIPAPTWFKALDVVLAYLPMAWLGGRVGGVHAPAGAA